MDPRNRVSSKKAVQFRDEATKEGAQSVDRAATLLVLVGRAGDEGARLSDLVSETKLAKPTVRRILLALVRAGLLDQDPERRRYLLGPELYLLGTIANSRFGIHPVSMPALARLSQASGDTAFLSVARDVYSICLHREDGTYPVRVQSLQAGDRHPLGVGAGSLALLAELPDDDIEQALAANDEILKGNYPNYSPKIIRRLVTETREQGYAFNPGMLLSDSWAIGVAIKDSSGRGVAALSIAALKNRLTEGRRRELVPILRREAAWVSSRLQMIGAKR
jgi:DNA-binding IclR family transcriptional regulator